MVHNMMLIQSTIAPATARMQPSQSLARFSSKGVFHFWSAA